MIDAQLIIDEARGWIGTPYVLQGRMKAIGVDCVGHISEVGKALGAIPASYSPPPYHADVDGKLVVTECDKMLERISQIELGAIVATRFKGRLVPQHLGIVANYKHGGFSMVQALSNAAGKGRVVEHVMDALTFDRICAIYRYRQL